MSGAIVAEAARRDLECGDGRCDPALLEALADHAFDTRTDADGVIAAMAEGQGFTVLHDPGVPEGVLGLLMGRKILVRPGLALDLLALVIAHELAHGMLAASGLPDPHGDVWRLTLALVGPRTLLKRLKPSDSVHLAACLGVPWWVARLRLDMTVVIAY